MVSPAQFMSARKVLRFSDILTPGNVYFVSSVTGSATGGYTADDPITTLAAAIALCTANQGDVIFVLPGHTETIATPGGIACNKAGVRIIGLGVGTNRPTFSWSATDSTWTVTAANVHIENIRCTASIDEVVKLISVSAANCTLDKVDYFETTSCQAIQFLLTTAAADGITVRSCRHIQGTAAGSAQKWLELVGVDDCEIVDNIFRLTLNNAAGSVTISGSTAIVRGIIARNSIVQLGGTSQLSAILLVDGSTAFVHDNRCACGSTALAGICNVGNAGYAAENYCLNTAAKSGIIDPVADT